MTLQDMISEVESRTLTLTVFNAEADAVDELRDRFADRHVVVEGATTPSGHPSAYVTLADESGTLSSVGVDDLLALLDDPTLTGLNVTGHRPILDYLSETLFTSWDPTQMLAATREIEDRAWRLRRGRLHVGFQNLAILEGELDVYERLGASDIDIRMFTAPNGTVPDLDSVPVHVEDSPEIERCWFLVFDGDGDPNQKCALVAEEREDRRYYGFWTYEPETVDRIFEYLDHTYDAVTQ